MHLFTFLIFATVLWKFEGTFSVQPDMTGLPAEMITKRMLEKVNSRLEIGSGVIGDRPLVLERDWRSERDQLWQLVASSFEIIPLEGIVSAPLEYKSTNPSHDIMPSHLNLQMRLQKLEYYFTSLRINDEDCRLQLLCQLAQNPVKYSPLSFTFLDETRYNGEVKDLKAQLLTSNDGAQLLTYIEAVHKGKNGLGCSVWEYRCPTSAESMINFKALLVWREISKWLTIQMITKR